MGVSECNLSQPSQREPVTLDSHYAPSTISLAEQLKCCLQEEAEPVEAKDFTKLLDRHLLSFDTVHVPEVLRTYQQLDVKHEPITLIPPNVQKKIVYTFRTFNF